MWFHVYKLVPIFLPIKSSGLPGTMLPLLSGQRKLGTVISSMVAVGFGNWWHVLAKGDESFVG